MSDQKKINSPYSTNSIQDFFEADLLTPLPDYGLKKVDCINRHDNVVDLFEMNHASDKYMVSVIINGKPQCFEVDTGAKF